MGHNKLWRILKEMGIPDHLTCLLRNLCAVRKQQLELDMEQQTGSSLGKEYIKAVYFHPAYLTFRFQRIFAACTNIGISHHKILNIKQKFSAANLNI